MNDMRITVPLSRDEFIALRELASVQLRLPRDQARYLVRLGLGLAGATNEPNNHNRAVAAYQSDAGAIVATQ